MSDLVDQVASIVDILLDVSHKNLNPACYTLPRLRGEGGILDEMQLLELDKQPIQLPYNTNPLTRSAPSMSAICRIKARALALF